MSTIKYLFQNQFVPRGQGAKMTARTRRDQVFFCYSSKQDTMTTVMTRRDKVVFICYSSKQDAMTTARTRRDKVSSSVTVASRTP